MRKMMLAVLTLSSAACCPPGRVCLNKAQQAALMTAGEAAQDGLERCAKHLQRDHGGAHLNLDGSLK